MKKSGIIKLILAVAVIFLLVRLCSQNFGSVIQLPGGSGSGTTSEKESGGWLNPKKSSNDGSLGEDLEEEIRELERELGIGSNKGKSTTKNTTTTTTTSPTTTTNTFSNPLTFKGIPMTGTLTAFGNELVKAGFRSAGNGTFTGDFAGYSGCKVTLVGNPVQEVRVDFPVISDWDALEKAYDSLQADLTQKYGLEPKTSSGSNLAVYNLPNGTISLDADVSKQSSWHVILTYANAASFNTGTNTGRSAIDDL